MPRACSASLRSACSRPARLWSKPSSRKAACRGRNTIRAGRSRRRVRRSLRIRDGLRYRSRPPRPWWRRLAAGSRTRKDGPPSGGRRRARASKMLEGDDRSLAASLKARAALLAQIMDDVARAQRSRHAMTLAIGEFEPGEEATGRSPRSSRRHPGRSCAAVTASSHSRRTALPGARLVPGAEAEAAIRRLFLAAWTGKPERQRNPDPRPVAGLRVGAASAPDHAVVATNCAIGPRKP